MFRFALISLLVVAATEAQSQALSATGQTSCYAANVATDCVTDTTYPRQDGSYGSALSYSRLDSSGNAVDAAATDWACARDEATGLVWEAKGTVGLRDAAHRYAWSNADAAANGGDAGGTSETGWCGDTLGGLPCTSEAYVAAVNAAGLCGFNDWRVPTQRELLSLVHAGRVGPSIDVAAFPATAHGVYWAADTYAPIPAFAWGVHFGYGAANADYKTRPYHLRLVRGPRF